MTDLATFNKQINRFLQESEIDFITFQKKVSFEIFAGVIKKTPVRTGWAQNSWNISVGSVDTSVPAEPEGNASPAAFGALAKMQGVRLSKVGQIVYISNNLSYILPLEEGSSDRAPNGMVKVTISEVQSQVNSLLRR